MRQPDWPGGRVLALSRLMLWLGSRWVALLRRSDWLAEWEGELWALHDRGESGLSLLRFGLAGMNEARWERRMEEGAMSGLVQDVRLALRRLARTPGFAAVVVVVLALGIGANTALFGALKAALLSNSPYPDADRLVLVDLLMQRQPGAPADTAPWSYPKFEMMRNESSLVDPVAGYFAATGSLTGDGQATRIGVEYVTPAYLVLLGVRPVVGRLFTSAEEYPNIGAVVMLGDALWRSRFGGDARVIGRTITLDGAKLEVVGVLPRGFRGLSGSGEAWVPVSGLTLSRGPRRLQSSQSHWLRAMGRLQDGATVEQASAEGGRIGASIAAAYPEPAISGNQGVAVVGFLRARVNPVSRLAVSAVSIGAFLLLLIACANVGGLLLARGSARRGDLAVRAALGAGRARLARESLLESAILALGGGAAGLALAFAGQRIVGWAVRNALDTSGTRGLQYLDADALAFDGGVLAAGVTMALATGLVFGLLPAYRASRTNVVGDMGSGSRTLDRRAGLDGGRGILVIGQLALTLILLTGAGVMGASLAALSRIDTGFDHTNVLALRFDRGPAPSAEQNQAFEDRLLEQVGALPGVAAVATAPCAPLAGYCEIVGLRQVDDNPPAEFGRMAPLSANEVSHSYWATLGSRLIEGRTFDESNRAGSPPVVVINETAAKNLFGDRSAIGHRIAMTHSLTDGSLAEIIGVVEDVRLGGLDEPAMQTAFLSRRQTPNGYGTLLVRAAGDPWALLDGVRGIVASMDPDLPLYDVTTLAEIRRRETARTRVLLSLLGVFALIGLLLSSVGLYGTVSWAVTRRTREMGLRMVLGAASQDVVRLVMRPPVLLATAGAVAGLAGAVGLTRFVALLLFEVRPSDPAVLATATVVMLGVAVFAAWLPARRATRVEPASALRAD